MGRKSLKEIRQKEILQVFYQVAQEEGLENTSFAKIASKMDINPSLIIHYFKSREDMILALIDFIVDQYKSIYQVNHHKSKKPLDQLLGVIDNIFSREWNMLFADSVFYSCFALIFRNEIIRQKYKELHEFLRGSLAVYIQQCNEEGSLSIKDAHHSADLIFLLSDGAYYYLSMIDDPKEYQDKLMNYKKEALNLLGLSK
ncbi:TetR family transcriptional regulator [Rapidithrix thailandica]|uniref:Biofilm operon icaADBC HTH-type negative transcriptional regulator IcaR n=1 Tax=Rapidithrix thailandica TaxID=413964 RepID=A0AAW9S4A1_9BACT